MRASGVKLKVGSKTSAKTSFDELFFGNLIR